MDIRSRLLRVDPIWATSVPIYSSDEVLIHEGVTVLLGCNGAGKTTLMRQIKTQMDGNALYSSGVFWYDPKAADQKLSLKAGFGSLQDIGGYLSSKFLSEGEELQRRIEMLISDLGKAVTEAENDGLKELWILFDSLDSGWSVDKIKDFCEFVNETVIKTCPENLYLFILIAANSYEFTRPDGWHLLDVQNLRYLNPFDSYEDYCKFVLDTRDRKQSIWKAKSVHKDK